ncbi:MAG: hypothetical protein J0M07_20160 [Anaerolineae bacterium]|nr:hypothetical protein [Anaerolineae bacterium]
MQKKIEVDWDDALAVIKYKNAWHFYVDMEIMFLLDYTAYDSEYKPAPGRFRYGTLIVDENNTEIWLGALARKLAPDLLLHTYWENTEKRVLPTFVIDFDQKLWVGNNWHHDQSPLHKCQPAGWTALEDDVMTYLPSEIQRYFAM